MKSRNRKKRWLVAAASMAGLLILALMTFVTFGADVEATPPWRSWFTHRAEKCADCDGPDLQELGGSWYWLRSSDQEKRVVISLYNRYCIRCHGVDGRGVWDIPDVPDLTNAGWQASRADGQLARRILEGRGAVMPAFRGTLSLEEAWAMSRYLRTFIPGTEVSRPDFSPPKKLELPGK